MGIDDRDYLRTEDRYVPFVPRGGTWAIKYVVIANIAVFLLQNLPGGIGDQITNSLALRLAVQVSSQGAAFEPVTVEESGRGVRAGGDAARAPRRLEAGASVEVLGMEGPESLVREGNRVGIVPTDALAPDLLRSWPVLWQVVTSGFCHSTDGAWHILINMFMLWMFGRAVEPILGSREFLAFYLCGIAAASICHLGVQMFQHVPVGAVGASGGVMAVVFLTAMYFPHTKVLLFFVIPIPLWLLAVLYAVADVAGFLNPASHVAHAAHLGGAAFGVAYKYFDWRLLPLATGCLASLRGWRRTASRPRVRIHRPSRDEVRRRVDALLEKIHRDGEASLTDEERDFLRDASREFRNR